MHHCVDVRVPPGSSQNVPDVKGPLGLRAQAAPKAGDATLRPLFVPEPDGIHVIPSAGVSSKNTGEGKGFRTPDATDGIPRPPSINEPDYTAVLGQIRTIREGQA